MSIIACALVLFLIWYLIGVVLTILSIKVEAGSVYVSDIPDILGFGFMGLIMLAILIMESMHALSHRLPNKKLW